MKSSEKNLNETDSVAESNDSSENECQVPPEGWYCTREPGHEGPCPEIPQITIHLQKHKPRKFREKWWQFWRPKIRRLKAEWTVETAEELEEYHDIDDEALDELVKELSSDPEFIKAIEEWKEKLDENNATNI